jgi:hypothetical protein
VGNCELRNEAQNEMCEHLMQIKKYKQEVTYFVPDKKIQARSHIFCSGMPHWKHVSTDEMNFVIPLFMLMGII